MKDIFRQSPTVGSLDYQTENNDLRARVEHLERENRDAHQRANQQQEKPRKSLWKRFVKVFKEVVRPILDFIPKALNAWANFKYGTNHKYA